ncbi:MAG: hypothetical protein LBF88_14670, partial [Planctomycetaceae bacterium]|nr:hypothetical protein [Planctomycetaceae bacterium]
MEEINRNENNQTVYTNKPTPKIKKPEPVHLETNNDSTSPFNAEESGMLNDISVQQQPLQPVDSRPLPKTETGFAVVFQYRIQDGDERPESYFNQQITKKIDTTNIPTGSVGVPYELVIDFTTLAKDLKIIDPKPNTVLGNRGFEVIAKGNKITIKGTPRDDIDATLNFCFKKENKKIQDMGHDEFPYSRYPKPFLIHPHPRDLWKNLPVTDYEGY